MEEPGPLMKLGKAITLLAIVIVMLFPMVYVVSMSFSSAADAARGGLVLFPKNPTLEAYRAILSGGVVQRALQVNPRHPVAMAQLGDLYEINGRPEEARALYQRSLAGNPYQAEVKARMAGTSMHSGFKTVLYVFKMFLSILVVLLRERILKPAAAGASS